MPASREASSFVTDRPAASVIEDNDAYLLNVEMPGSEQGRTRNLGREQ